MLDTRKVGELGYDGIEFARLGGHADEARSDLNRFV